MIWYFIHRRINPSTKVGVSKLKEDIESKVFNYFGDDILKLNTWFEDTMNVIIAAEAEGYNKYIRMLFKTYRKFGNSKFGVAIKQE